ncbi:uncharacterized protein LOC142625032 [Castanea sativa]|uniref:uncharacterized protein LOC142625032 n=1 Tax=Castanea sativa TaxID=21020 RepID=UPI003F64EFDB
MDKFIETINWCSLRDIGFVGPRFTWLYRKSDGSQIRERLDGALVTSDWLNRFPSAKLFHLSSSASDHSPLSLRLVPKPRSRMAGKLFRFESMWLKEPRCAEIVQEAWGEGLREASSDVLGKCLESGDRNTRFFHAKASARYSKNLISGLMDAREVWQEEDSKVEEIVVDYYQTLFTSSNPSDFVELLQAVNPR